MSEIHKINVERYVIGTYEVDYIKKIKGLYGFIYITTNLENGKLYVGQRKISKGWERYLGSGKLFLKALEKYGRDNFHRDIIDIAFTPNELNMLENMYTHRFDSVDSTQWYNLCHGGSGVHGISSHQESEEKNRIYLENNNFQNCLMKIIRYNNANDITIEFQDEYKYKKETTWNCFLTGQVKNPYFKSVYGVGMIGYKHPKSYIGKEEKLKEYTVWKKMIQRCYSKDYISKDDSYADYTVCDEWLIYDNFYEWIHSQSNCDKWIENKHWALSKSIIKNVTKYSPETCFLVPQYVNNLFMKNNAIRGDFPIGVRIDKKTGKFIAQCKNSYPGTNNLSCKKHLTVDEAFISYKEYKENLIKFIADTEFQKGNISKECRDSMYIYQVEITD